MEQIQYNTKKRKWKQLCEKERYQIEALSRQGLTPAEIGNSLNPKRDRRTIEREIARGLTLQRDSDLREKHIYLADVGQRKHDEKSRNKGRGYKIGHDHELVRHIENKIKDEKYSPDAVIGEIKEKGLSFQVTICTKTLYNYIDSGLFLNISNQDLPVKKNGRKRKYRPVRKVALNNIKGRIIEERPQEVESRDKYGHWEMDCVVGRGKACLLVLTERMSRQELIFKMPAKTQKYVIDVINRLERRYKGKFYQIFKSFTMDNGSEFLDIKGIERSCRKSGTRRTICYYAHPYSSWERGSNENQNKLIRRFVPKGSNIDKLTHQDVKRIENWINSYPRRIFGYKSANQMAA